MGEISAPQPVKAFCALLAGKREWIDLAVARLVDRFGPTDLVGEIWPFDFTDYYADEMGRDLKRCICSFARLIDPARIVEWKLATNELEERMKRELGQPPRRPLNLDPGYLSRPKLVLATTKDYAHRIYLRDGIYAETTLRWRDGQFEPWEWTYPDYQSRRYHDFFRKVRQNYMCQLRNCAEK